MVHVKNKPVHVDFSEYNQPCMALTQSIHLHFQNAPPLHTIASALEREQ